jgi:hypothetical protein
MHRVATWLADRGPLRVDLERAAETIFALASPTLPGCTVTAGAGRTRYADWLEDALVRALLPDDPTPPGR